MELKRCPRCRIEKGRNEFGVRRRNRDGLGDYCKPCTAARVREQYARNPNFRKPQWKRYEEGHKEQIAAYQREYRRAHLDKYYARKLVFYAIKCGMLVREPCEVCGKPDGEAAHSDYSRPLEVRWLCSLHHARADFGKYNEAA